MPKFPDNFPAEAEEHLFYEELGRAVAYWGQVEGKFRASSLASWADHPKGTRRQTLL
jgi:hypothetical protein